MFDSKGGTSVQIIRNKYQNLNRTGSAKIPIKLALNSYNKSIELPLNKQRNFAYNEERSPNPKAMLSARNPRSGKICRNNNTHLKQNPSKTAPDKEFQSARRKFQYMQILSKTHTSHPHPVPTQKRAPIKVAEFDLTTKQKKSQQSSTASTGSTASTAFTARNRTNNYSSKDLDSQQCIENIEQIQNKIKSIFLMK